MTEIVQVKGDFHLVCPRCGQSCEKLYIRGLSGVCRKCKGELDEELRERTERLRP